MAYFLDPEVFEEEDGYEDPSSFEQDNPNFDEDEERFPDFPSEEELNDMYYYFNNTYDDPIKMCDVRVM